MGLFDYLSFRWPVKIKTIKNGASKEIVSNAEPPTNTSALPPGRTSEPEIGNDILAILKGYTKFVTPSFRSELIPLIRDLYKVNPDVSIAVQDMFKLANTGHRVSFPYNTDEEADKMNEYLKTATKRWSNYTAGIDGLVNKMIVQCLIGGAISVEGVPNRNLKNLSTILFINPENIVFKREYNGVYHPYQINKNFESKKGSHIKLNLSTYRYCAMYNDVDEPYGVPPFLSALDSLKTQEDMKINMKHILEIVGMIGFLEAKMQKPFKKANENDSAYEKRLQNTLIKLKGNLVNGLKDGVVTGYIDDHEFSLNSTSANLNNVDKLWSMNQQSVANGLGVNSNLIGVDQSTNEGAAGIYLSKMISQLKNIQMMVSDVLEFLYSLELLLAGYNCKGVTVKFNSSTVTDEVKIQQAIEYKIRNLVTLYLAGTISLKDFANELGYVKPDQNELRVPIEALASGSKVSTPSEDEDKKKREADKDKSDRKVRDKKNPSPKRKDTSTKER